MKIVHTGNYKNCLVGNTISISGDSGKLENYKGLSMSNLSPKKEFYDIWKANQGKISEEENNLYYIREYYDKVLRYLDPNEIISKFPENPILLCYEEPEEFCHRHLVAFWLELFLGIQTSEVKVNPKRETLSRLKRPEYLKKILEDVIKENYPMNNYESVQGAYLFNKSKEVDKVYKLENN